VQIRATGVSIITQSAPSAPRRKQGVGPLSPRSAIPKVRYPQREITNQGPRVRVRLSVRVRVSVRLRVRVRSGVFNLLKFDHTPKKKKKG